MTTEQAKSDEEQRVRLAKLLADGLDTEVEPRAYTHEHVLELIKRLRQINPEDVAEKLKLAGFTLTPYGSEDDEQSCETCMYYQVHRRFCELPELMLPVEPQWSCRLWRI